MGPDGVPGKDDLSSHGLQCSVSLTRERKRDQFALAAECDMMAPEGEAAICKIRRMVDKCLFSVIFNPSLAEEVTIADQETDTSAGTWCVGCDSRTS